MKYFTIIALKLEIQKNRAKRFRFEKKAQTASGDKLTKYNLRITQLNDRNLEMLDRIEEIEKVLSN